MRLVAVLLVFAIAILAGRGALERALLYPFDPARAPPPDGFAETTLETADGATLVVWAAAPRPGRPVVLYFCGNAGNLAARESRFRAFTARGLGVVAAGYRGSSGSTGSPSEAALIADAEALADALPGLVGDASVAYYGESLGAAVALALAATRPPAGIVLEAPFASLAAMSADLYGTSAPAALLRAKWPSRDRITSLTAPLLILHGAKDALVPPAQGRALFAAAPARDKTFLLVPDAGHTDVWQPQAQRALYAFLERL